MRVVAGELGGRRLRTPPGSGTRPTAERVRAALFDRLGRDVVDARVLDLYAGSGSLGIEALSRGAARATFVEQGARALGVLRRNLEDLGLAARGRVLASAVRRAVAALGAAGECFELVLVDAPYAEASDAWQGAVDLVAAGGILVAERDGRAPASALRGAVLERRAMYGTTALEFWRRREEED